jgi:hypothetical protein
MKQIFLVAGKAQHGKDSTGQILKEKLKGKTLILHNADYLKYIAKEYLNWNGIKDDKSRTLLQQLGTEKVRNGLNRPLFWVEKSCDIIDILLNDFDYFIICDCRFKNEIHFPKARFPNYVTSIRVERLNFDNGLTEEQKNHLSETDLDNFIFDYYIKSESGLNNLEKEVDKLILKLKTL